MGERADVGGDREQFDVLIIGAGISGIGAAHYLRRSHPDRRIALLEARERIGGTWDLFRYPGIRSDSDLHTFGYEFKPWTGRKAIADGDSILRYLREVCDQDGTEALIRFRHRMVAADWSSEERRWHVHVERTDTGERLTLTTRWLFSGGGYYRYDHGYTPDLPGIDRYRGRVVHPQQWPEDLDWSGLRIVVVGSGATAVTLVPALADKAAHVTMLQRTPTYVVPVPAVDPVAQLLRRWFGDGCGHAMTRRLNIRRQRVVWVLSRRRPDLVRRLIRWTNVRSLPEGYPVDVHFNPPYDPWDQRLCVVPDGDLFKAIRDGSVDVVTDRIATFDEDGIVLESGGRLDADLVVTATGLAVEPLGGVDLRVDGRPVALEQTIAFKGFMLSGVPNFAYSIGYTNSSWTLKVGLLCEHFCRLLSFMDRDGYDVCVPNPSDPTMRTRPFLDFGAGYIRRVVDRLPRQGDRWPWQTSMNYLDDVRLLRRGSVDGPELSFRAGVPHHSAADVGAP